MTPKHKVSEKHRRRRDRAHSWPWYPRWLLKVSTARKRNARSRIVSASRKALTATVVVPVLAKASILKTKNIPVLRSKLSSRKAKGAKTYVNPYTKTRTDTRRLFRYSGFALPLTQQPNQAITTTSWSRSKTGNYKPNWRAVIRASGNATTPFDAWVQAADFDPGVIRFYHDWRSSSLTPWISSYTTDNFVNFMTPSPIGSHAIPGVAQKAQDRAASLLVKKIHQAHHQLQGGVILGEIDKTARLLIGTARNLKQGVFNYLGNAVGIRRGKGTRGSKRKAIANSYLEATFGWQPLLGDCKDFAKTLGRLTTEVDRTYLRAVAEWEEQFSQTSTVCAGVGNMSALRTDTTKTYSRVMYRGYLQGLPYESGKPALERIISMSGFDLRSFVPTMWELVPYSFLVDYFTNIGDCLLSWTVDTTPVKALWRTQVTETIREIRMSPLYEKSLADLKANLGTNGRNYSGWKKDGLSTILYRTVSRNTATVPLLVPQLTGLDLPWRQFANIGALIQGKSGRNVR